MRRSEDENGLFDEWAQRMSELEEEGWAYRLRVVALVRYPTKDIDLRKTTWLAPEVIRAFMGAEAVDPLVCDIQATIDRIEGLEPCPSGRRASGKIAANASTETVARRMLDSFNLAAAR